MSSPDPSTKKENQRQMSKKDAKNVKKPKAEKEKPKP